LLASNDLDFEIIESLIRENTHINGLDFHIEHSFIFGDTAQGLEHSTHCLSLLFICFLNCFFCSFLNEFQRIKSLLIYVSNHF